MSKRKRKARSALRNELAGAPGYVGGIDYGNAMYWQSADYNARICLHFERQILRLAISRFKYVNLPPTCDARYLEWTLLTKGIATIAEWGGNFYSTQAITQNPLNVYDTPSKWVSFGNNGWRFPCTAKNGVLIYENELRVPIIEDVRIYAQELADIWRTRQGNRILQRMPFIITGPQEYEQVMANLYKQVVGGEPAVIGTDNLLNDVNISVFQTGVKYMGEEMDTSERQLWAEVYKFLGIDSLSPKHERMIEDEVQSQSQPSSLMALSEFDARRSQLEKLNRRFGFDAQVVWNQDNASDNWNYVNNIKEVESDGE